jgi:hypothetical protein
VLDCEDPAPYGWQRQLTLDGAQIPGDLTSSPVLVRVTDAHLQANAAADGGDIYFTAADRATSLEFELESYTASNGTLVAWVSMPSLSAGSDAVLHVGYGDGRGARSNAASVWGAYRNVWHLAQDPSLGSNALRDSTQRAHGTAQGGMLATALVAGVAGQGLSFDGSDDRIEFTNDLTGSGPSTFSGWLNQATDPADLGSAVISIGEGQLGHARFLLSQADGGKLKTGFYGKDELTDTVVPTGVWKYLVWVWTGSTSEVYVDGVSLRAPVPRNDVATSGAAGCIGAGTFGYAFFLTGQLDEVRIAGTARTAASITAEYNNQRPGSTFIKTLGGPMAAASH